MVGKIMRNFELQDGTRLAARNRREVSASRAVLEGALRFLGRFFSELTSEWGQAKGIFSHIRLSPFAGQNFLGQQVAAVRAFKFL